MKTKLVYVLTCAPEKDYIEQAHMAIWSARHYNPDATIVLIVDDKTDALLTGKRAEILNYVSEKIIVPFEDATLSPLYRSRWIKTQVRELVKGDILFVDSDTICCRSLSEVDDFGSEVCAVADNNTPFQRDRFKDDTIRQVAKICDISREEYYFSSGVLFCKDTPAVHKLFALWHTYWKEGTALGLSIDQPALAKSNIELGYIITQIDDVYNCVLYTQNKDLRDAAILHISKYPLTSFLFKPKTLAIIRTQGITPWIAELITHVHATYMPFDYAIKHSTLAQRKQWICEIAYAVKMYGIHLDSNYEELVLRTKAEPVIKKMFTMRLYHIGVFLWLESRYWKLRMKNNINSNICSVP